MVVPRPRASSSERPKGESVLCGRGFGITYNSKANPILSAVWIWAIGLWDFGCAGLRTLRIVRIGAYRKYARERILFFGGGAFG